MSSDRHIRMHEFRLLALSGIILMVITSSIIVAIDGDTWEAIVILAFWIVVLTLIMTYNPDVRKQL